MWAPPQEVGQFQTTSLGSPTGGLNTRDSLVAMPPTDAVVLRNWWPQIYGCTVRRGTQLRCSGFPGAVSTLATWTSATGVSTLLAWSLTSLYNATPSGPIGAAILTGLSNAIWQTINYSNSAGIHLIAVNGADDAILYNAGGVSRIVAGAGGAGTWAGVAPTSIVQVTIHQSRLWGVEKNTSYGWYLPTDAIFGTMTRFDFGPLFPRGGTLEFLTTWTLDDGNGAEDHLVALSNQGDAVVYAGTNPGSAATWALVGVYFIGAPVSGRRSFTKAGGDLLVLTQQGVVSMSELLTSTKVNQAENPLTSLKVQSLISDLISLYSANPNWALRFYPKYNMLLLNVPINVVGTNIQLAANQLIGSWTQFTGMDAASWGIINSDPVYGDTVGNIYNAWTGYKDKVLVNNTGGTSIVAYAQTAFSFLGKPTLQKQVGMYRPYFIVSNPISFASKIFYDFDLSALGSPNALPNISSSVWNTGIWDVNYWGGNSTLVQRTWIQAQGSGTAISLGMVVNSEGPVLWVSTDFTNIVGDGVF